MPWRHAEPLPFSIAPFKLSSPLPHPRQPPFATLTTRDALLLLVLLFQNQRIKATQGYIFLFQISLFFLFPYGATRLCSPFPLPDPPFVLFPQLRDEPLNSPTFCAATSRVVAPALYKVVNCHLWLFEL